MTLWLTNLTAYSAQLAVLVVVGAIGVAALRVDAPGPSLRFWQVLFGSTLLWPCYQLWESVMLGTPVPASRPWTVTSLSADAGIVVAVIDDRATAAVVAVIAIGAAVRLGWLVLGLVRLRTIAAEAEPAPALSAAASPWQRALGTTAAVRFSDAVASPATIGAWRPVVLLPHAVRDLAPAMQRAVLCHELLHVRHRHWIPTVLEEVWCACLWFHPAARLMASRLALAREMVVDEAAIALTKDRRAYAAALLEFSTSPQRVLATTALIGRRHLEQRIARIAQEAPMSRSAVAVRLSLAAGVVALATLATSSVIPISAASQAKDETVYVPNRDDVTLPSVLTEVKPHYTAAAMQAKIEGSVFMSVVVRSDGTVGDVTVTQSLDQEHGLDQQAVGAARQWTFKPGLKDGRPVNVEVMVEMTFTLKKSF